MYDSVRGCSCRYVACHGGHHGGVHLCLVVAAQQEHDVLAHKLQRFVVTAGKSCDEIHEPVARQELSDTKMINKPLMRSVCKKRVSSQACDSYINHAQEGCQVLQGACHVLHISNGCEENSNLHLVCPALVHAVHHHVGGGPHGVPDVVDLLLPSLLEDVVKLGGKVVLGHLIPSELPVLVISVSIKRNMSTAVAAKWLAES